MWIPVGGEGEQAEGMSEMQGTPRHQEKEETRLRAGCALRVSPWTYRSRFRLAFGMSCRKQFQKCNRSCLIGRLASSPEGGFPIRRTSRPRREQSKVSQSLPPDLAIPQPRVNVQRASPIQSGCYKVAALHCDLGPASVHKSGWITVT